MGGKLLKFALILLILFFGINVFGYDNLITHPLLSGSAAEIYNQSAGLKLTDQQKSWIIKGSTDEDLDPRYLNHFYDPITGRGLNGVDTVKGAAIKVSGRPAKSWAQNQSSYAGDYSESAILKNYRDGNLMRAYQGVGHIMHLIQDMAVPAHTRNDPHAMGDPYEKWAEQYATISSAKLKFLSIDSLDQAFDLMANYSNNNFYSKDTISLGALDNYKVITDKTNNLNINYVVSFVNSRNFRLCKLDNSSIRPICKINDDDFKLNLDYWNMLYPKAAGYSAGVIDYFVKKFEQIDKDKKERERLSLSDKLKNYFARLKNEAQYTLGDVVFAQRNVLAKGYDKVAVAITGAQNNFKNFSDANRDTLTQAAAQGAGAVKRAGAVLSAYEVGGQEGANTRNMPDSPSAPAEEPASPDPAVVRENGTSADAPLLPAENANPLNSPSEAGENAENSTPLNQGGHRFAPIFTAGDALAPETEITSGPQKVTNFNYAEFIFTASEVNSVFECDLDNAGWQACGSPKNLSGLAEGAHVFKVRAVDAANNADQTPAEYGWTADLTPPIVAINSSPAYYASSTSASFGFEADNAGAVFSCNLDENGWPECSSPANYENLSGGAHNFKVKALDSAGNESLPAEFSWSVSTSSPDVTIVSGPPDIASSSAAQFQFYSSYSSAAYQCQLDYGGWQFCAASATAESLVEGSHIFEVKAADQAGNLSSPAARTWLIDLTPPDSAVAGLPENFEATGFTVSWSGTDDNADGATSTVSGIASFDLQYKIGESDWQDWLAETTATSSVFNLAVEGGQTVYFRSRAKDAAGNLESWPADADAQAAIVLKHLLISQVKTGGASADDEFIEIYNPTDSDISLNGYSIQYRGGAAQNFSKKDFFTDSVVKAEGYFLITSGDYAGSVSADFTVGFNLSGVGGNIFLVSDTTKLTDEAISGASVIDRLAYGAGSYLFPEGAAYGAAPAAGQSLLRKAGVNATVGSMATGADQWQGNGYDSDNNNTDFVLLATAMPNNSDSPAEPTNLAPVMPGAIYDLTANQSLTTPGNITLNWTSTANSRLTDSAFYEIKYLAKSGDCALQLNWVGAMATATSSLSLPSATVGSAEQAEITGLSADTEYCFAVRIFNGEYWSNLSNQVSAKTALIQNIVTIGETSFALSNWKDSFSWKHMVAGDDPVLLVSLHGDGSYLSNDSVAFNGQPLTLAVKHFNGVPYNNLAVYIYYMPNPPQGEHEITVNIGAPGRPLAASAATFLNCDTANPIGAADSFYDVITPMSHSVAAVSGMMLVDAVTYNREGLEAVTPAAGQTQYFSQTPSNAWRGQTNDLYAGGSYKSVGQAGSSAMGWATETNRSRVQAIIALKPKP